jgi:hypothetical protein
MDDAEVNADRRRDPTMLMDYVPVKPLIRAPASRRSTSESPSPSKNLQAQSSSACPGPRRHGTSARTSRRSVRLTGMRRRGRSQITKRDRECIAFCIQHNGGLIVSRRIIVDADEPEAYGNFSAVDATNQTLADSVRAAFVFHCRRVSR